jgi:dipeptide transport system permease protein
VLRGRLGRSLVTKEPVLREFACLFPATVELATTATLLALVVGLPIGVLAAIRRGSILDYLTMGISVTGYSMPIFWWGLLLILLFSVHLHWTPVSGRISDFHFFEPLTGFMLVDALLQGDRGSFGSAVRHLLLPATAWARSRWRSSRG